MLSDVRILGTSRQAQAALHARVDPLTQQRLAETQDPARWREILSTARFTPPCPCFWRASNCRTVPILRIPFSPRTCRMRRQPSRWLRTM
ncbi:hypothetical protein RAA17_25330 [Komagataeibacter rhaeticus]|nr:hypothetical protein [Komagataeibacter rhaeticus]